jgi:hypothetical protein
LVDALAVDVASVRLGVVPVFVTELGALPSACTSVVESGCCGPCPLTA